MLFGPILIASALVLTVRCQRGESVAFNFPGYGYVGKCTVTNSANNAAFESRILSSDDGGGGPPLCKSPLTTGTSTNKVCNNGDPSNDSTVFKSYAVNLCSGYGSWSNTV